VTIIDDLPMDMEDDLLEQNEEEMLSAAIADDELDETSQAFVDQLVDKIIRFMDALSGREEGALYPYQERFARRMIESVVIGDAEEITALFSRQSGKSETVANVVATLMILLPRLAHIYPDLLGKFKDGMMVGLFAPVESQAETLFSRVVSRLTSQSAQEILADPEIDDKMIGKSREIRLVKCGSFLQMATANPRAQIESKSYHLIVVDEAQAADDFVVRKSIHPMGAFYAATIVKTGTPTTHKGDFWKAIQLNKRRATKRAGRVNHFEANWKECARYNPNYAKSVRKEMLRMGEDSDEFQMSFNLKWLLERGMFVTSETMDQLGDKSMEIQKFWTASPVVVGIDPARKVDSTVVTVVWVDWDRPDEFGYYDHRVLNWLEIQGDDWESQYGQIVDFLRHYDVLAVGVDANGVGDAVAQRLQILLPRAEVHLLGSSPSEQSKRWKHVTQLIQRGLVSWPAHAKTRRLKTWRRFYQQMIDAEKEFKGPNILVAAPNEAEAHDDYVDSLAIACSMTADLTMPEVEVSSNPFYSSRFG
jgi:hypothetical protein